MTARTWADFCRLIKQAEADLGKGPFWYRGVEDAKYTLTPSLFRYDNGKDKETDLYWLYSQSRLRESAAKKSSWETLFDMQHYGVPTRLLDWTEVLGIAVYFACALPTGVPSVFVLSPERLNLKSDRASIVLAPSGEAFDYESVYWRKSPPPSHHPLAISPTSPNERLQRQRGKFTIHGSSGESLESQCADCVRKISLSPEARDEAREFLKTANLNAFSIFPDFFGMAQFVKTEAQLEPVSFEAVTESAIAARLVDVLAKDREAFLTPDPERRHGRQFNVRGIASCVIGDDYVPRPTTEQKLADWFQREDAPLLFVTGEAGIGKTNFLLKVALDRKVLQNHPIIFFALPLYEVTREGSDDAGEDRETLIDLIVAHALRKRVTDHEKAAVCRMIRDGRVPLVLDGMDELARVRGEIAVRHVVRDLDHLIADCKRPKVIVACRDHILRRLQRAGVMASSLASAEIRLDKLDQEQVHSKLCSLFGYQSDSPQTRSASFSRLTALARVPLFFGLVRRIPDARQRLAVAAESHSRLYEAWFQCMLKNAKLPDAPHCMRRIGVVAAEMLKGRSDFLKVSALAPPLRELVEALCSEPLGVFFKEFKDTCGFAHQSLREFILAWSVAQEIKNRRPETLCSTPSFDYLGAETYRFVDELIDVKGDLLDQVGPLLRTKGLDDRGWNNLARNIFEAIGMLAPPRDDLLERIVPIALSVLRSTRFNGHYVRCRTKYNVARCLERIHWTAPRPYVTHVLTGEAHRGPPGKRRVAAYTIRGFHMRVPKPGPLPVTVFKRALRDGYMRELQTQVADCLLETIERHNDWEMAEDARFLRINVAHALVRWSPKSPDHSRIAAMLSDMKSPCRFLQTNVFYMLWVRHGNRIPGAYRAKHFDHVADLPFACESARHALQTLQRRR